MGCGCGAKTTKAATTSREHVYVDAQGNAKVYPSEIQARAAQVRAGGSGTVKPR
jgi:hypothetical protein